MKALDTGSGIMKAMADALLAHNAEGGLENVKMQMGGDYLEHDRAARKRNLPHPWLHPTKGWRNFARPSGTNRRRRLIPVGAGMVPGSHEYNRRSLSGGRWPKFSTKVKRFMRSLGIGNHGRRNSA